jgi:hypothetical protein
MLRGKHGDESLLTPIRSTSFDSIEDAAKWLYGLVLAEKRKLRMREGRGLKRYVLKSLVYTGVCRVDLDYSYGGSYLLMSIARGAKHDIQRT